MAENRDEKIVFMVSMEGLDDDGIPVVVLGIPEKAWEGLRTMTTQTFDLTKVGLPIKLIVFGGRDHQTCLDAMSAGVKAGGGTVVDQRNENFEIKLKRGH